MAKRPTSADVARAAGVSRATVSYVLNDVEHQRISAATRERVRAVAARLGYQPHPAARTLRTGSSDVILLSMPPWPLGPVIAEAITAAVDRFAALGYTALVHLDHGAAKTLPQACHHVRPLGLAAPGSRLSASLVRSLRASGTQAIVAVFDEEPVGFVPTIVVRQSEIGRVALDYLADAGHRRVLALMPDQADIRALGESRLAGATEIAAARQVRLTDVTSARRPDAVAEAVLRAVHGRNPPTAVFAFNDEYALLALRALAEGGVRVPEDVAVIGCDDSPPAEFAAPSLTSVNFSATSFGVTIADTLHAALAGTRLPKAILAQELFVTARESTAGAVDAAAAAR